MKLDGYELKIDNELSEIKTQEQLDTWLRSFWEIADYVKEKTNEMMRSKQIQS